ncbi:hypothetical protein [Iodobacter fluviatilis]|nr:hypothetical protein [Iodobacter fluviatilis]
MNKKKMPILSKTRRILARLQLDPVNRRIEYVQSSRIGLVVAKRQGQFATKVLENLLDHHISEIESKLNYAPVFCSTWLCNNSEALKAALTVKRQLALNSRRSTTREKRNEASINRRYEKSIFELQLFSDEMENSLKSKSE